MMTVREITAGAPARRLDQFLVDEGADLGLSRAGLQRLIRNGDVLLNGEVSKASAPIATGDRLVVTVPPPRAMRLEAQPIPLNVVYDDAEMLVVDKPAGLTTHPAPGRWDGTLVNALLARYPDLPGIGGERRPGIVHRLDKDTSGLMMVAKTEAAHRSLSQQIKDRAVRKEYTALAHGAIANDGGMIDVPIGRDRRNRKRMAAQDDGRPAQTRFRVLRRLERYTLAMAQPITGRTHQIRVHFAFMGHPLVGDKLYGGRREALDRQFLHASRLAFRHPVDGRTMDFASPIAADLQEALDAIDVHILDEKR